jgi:hypothetical protein
MQAFHVVQWAQCHENHESRKYGRLGFIYKPNKHDGLGFRRLVANEDRVALYAGWNLILEVASKSDRALRGWLVRDGRPLDAEGLSLMTGFPKEMFEKCLRFFIEPQMGWLEQAELPAAQGELPAPPGEPPGKHPVSRENLPAHPVANRTEQNRTEQKDSSEAKKNSSGSLNGGKEGPGMAEVLASRTQVTALLTQLKEMEEDREDWTAEDRELYQKKRALLKRVQAAQAEGRFK